MTALLQSQKNEVLATIQRVGLVPREFDWDPAQAANYEEVFVHLPTKYWFRFQVSDFGHSYRYSPGHRQIVSSGELQAWQTVITNVETWLRAVQREAETPDLWAELRRERVLTGSRAIPASPHENTPFTREEQAEIRRQLNEGMAFVQQTLQLSEEQFEELTARLDYLADAATRMNRFDWKNTLTGTLVTAVIQSILPAEPVQAVLSLILRGVAALFGRTSRNFPEGLGRISRCEWAGAS